MTERAVRWRNWSVSPLSLNRWPSMVVTRKASYSISGLLKQLVVNTDLHCCCSEENASSVSTSSLRCFLVCGVLPCCSLRSLEDLPWLPESTEYRATRLSDSDSWSNAVSVARFRSRMKPACLFCLLVCFGNWMIMILFPSGCYSLPADDQGSEGTHERDTATVTRTGVLPKRR